MSRISALIALCLVAGAGESADPAHGKAVFERHCEPCHGAAMNEDGSAKMAGTEALRIKYRGTDVPPALEDRDDLTAAAIEVFVRQGVWSMPPFRPTEVTDADIEAIAAWLAKSSASEKR